MAYECKSEFKRMTKEYQYEGGMIGRNTRGTINELLVASDLLKKGYEVFRAECPACSCDLIILNNLKPYRVEVKTGCRVGGEINISRSKLNLAKFDILAIVFDGVIRYEPELPC